MHLCVVDFFFLQAIVGILILLLVGFPENLLIVFFFSPILLAFYKNRKYFSASHNEIIGWRKDTVLNNVPDFFFFLIMPISIFLSLYIYIVVNKFIYVNNLQGSIYKFLAC